MTIAGTDARASSVLQKMEDTSVKGVSHRSTFVKTLAVFKSRRLRFRLLHERTDVGTCKFTGLQDTGSLAPRGCKSLVDQELALSGTLQKESPCLPSA